MKPVFVTDLSATIETELEVTFSVQRTFDGDGYHEPLTCEDDVTASEVVVLGISLSPGMTPEQCVKAVNQILEKCADSDEVASALDTADISDDGPDPDEWRDDG